MAVMLKDQSATGAIEWPKDGEVLIVSYRNTHEYDGSGRCAFLRVKRLWGDLSFGSTPAGRIGEPKDKHEGW